MNNFFIYKPDKDLLTEWLRRVDITQALKHEKELLIKELNK